MKSYNALGWSILALHLAVAGLLAPVHWSFAAGALGGFAYLALVWFLAGIYLTDVVHMGIAHGALAFRPWFTQSVVVLYNTVGIYVNPVSWVNRHRHHHAFSDHDGDPNKLAADGFWRTLALCLLPYPCRSNLARDAILRSVPVRLVASPAFAMASQALSFGLLWLVVRDARYACALWLGVRVFALWVNMIQNYWSHERCFGTRRYLDAGDNAMNLCEWLPVTATFSACLQNNHHHSPGFLRTSHDARQYDFGLLSVRWLKRLGVVAATPTGDRIPPDVALESTGF